jgi:hypothetical protein
MLWKRAKLRELVNYVDRDTKPLIALTHQPEDVKEEEEDRNQRAHQAPELDTQE